MNIEIKYKFADMEEMSSLQIGLLQHLTAKVDITEQQIDQLFARTYYYNNPPFSLKEKLKLLALYLLTQKYANHLTETIPLCVSDHSLHMSNHCEELSVTFDLCTNFSIHDDIADFYVDGVRYEPNQ